jgi:putative transcriptional regulator
MSNIKSIRDRLGVTQTDLARALGKTQGNVSFYERGQMIPPDSAQKLIEFAATRGHHLTFNDIYASEVTGAEAGLAPAATDLMAAAKAGIDEVVHHADDLLAGLKKDVQADIKHAVLGLRDEVNAAVHAALDARPKPWDGIDRRADAVPAPPAWDGSERRSGVDRRQPDVLEAPEQLTAKAV